ncbi:MAG: hypothetical protein J6B00_03445 [Alphaproteobacteria bacterium]|nr:hypothetical protein [Alphaproteobacteria bacterium]
MNKNLEKIWRVGVGIAMFAVLLFWYCGVKHEEVAVWPLIMGGAAAWIAIIAKVLKTLRLRNGSYD